MFDRDTNDMFVRTARGANTLLSGNTIYLPGILHGKGHHFVGRAAVLLSSIPGFYDGGLSFASAAANAVSSDHNNTHNRSASYHEAIASMLPEDEEYDPEDLEQNSKAQQHFRDLSATYSADGDNLIPTNAASNEQSNIENISDDERERANIQLQRGGGGETSLTTWLTLYSKSGKVVGSVRISIKIVDDDKTGTPPDASVLGSGSSAGDDNNVVLDDTEVEEYASTLALHKEHWQTIEASNFNVRGENYLTDKKKIPSDGALLKLEAVEIVSVDDVETRVTKTRGRGVSDAMKRAGVDDISMENHYVILHFIVPGDKQSNSAAYSLAIYYSYSPNDDESATNAEKLLKKWLLQDDTKLANSRMKLIPKIQKGPWTMKNLIGAPCMLGKYSKLSFERSVLPNCHEVVIDCINSDKLKSKFTQIVKNIGEMVVDLAFVLQSEDSCELPEQIFATVRLSQLDLSALPDWGQRHHRTQTVPLPGLEEQGNAPDVYLRESSGMKKKGALKARFQSTSIVQWIWQVKDSPLCQELTRTFAFLLYSSLFFYIAYTSFELQRSIYKIEDSIDQIQKTISSLSPQTHETCHHV